MEETEVVSFLVYYFKNKQKKSMCVRACVCVKWRKQL